MHDAVHHGFIFFTGRAVDHVGKFLAAKHAVGGNQRNIQLVDLVEFGGFSFRRSGHAGKFFVHPKIVLEGDRCERLIFALDLDAFFCFHGLVQAVRPAASGHFASRKFIDDNDFAVFDHVFDVALIKRVSAESLINVVNRFHVLRVVHVAEAEQLFCFADAFFGKRRGPVFFLDDVIDILNQFWNDFVDAVILVGGLFGGAGNDQRSAGLVDQDGVHFVHDSEVMATLHTVHEIEFHVVAEVIESEFVVRAVGDIRAIGRAPLDVAQIVHDHADGHAQRTINRAHPLRVAPGQVIVHRDDVHAASGQRVQHGGKRGD